MAPSIDVDGVGRIALPLLPAQAKQLIKAASRAPYGRGADTLVDTKVRRTWQIEAERVSIGGKHWPKTLAGIVARAAEGLGVTGPVIAELYKLLVYDKGSFFVSHRDTEKTPGMFATLVIALPSHSGEMSPPDALDGLEPDEEHFHEATGNEGASFDRTYARAALVIWPRERVLFVINQAGPAGTLPYLDGLIDQWQAAGPKKGRALKAQAENLAVLMLQGWPADGWHERERTEPTIVGRMCRTLTRLGEPALVEQLLERLVGAASHASADNAAILDAMGLLADDVASAWLAKIAAAHGNDELGASAGLLRQALQGGFAKKPQQLRPAAEALFANLPGDPDKAPQDQWGRVRLNRPDSASLVDVIAIVDRVDIELAKRTAEHVLAWPRHFGLDALLVPSLKRLIQSKHCAGAAFEALHRAAVDHVQKRIAEPLEAPRDWLRPRQHGEENV